MKTAVDLNCDMSEGFGTWRIDGDIDGLLMPMVSSINVAGGFHAGDPATIALNVRRAREHGVGVGAHPGFRDLVGFGRRHIDAAPDELVADVIYQLGAVREFTRLMDVPLQHLKLHGALYMHAARDEDFATALVEALQRVDPSLPVLVMGGTVIDVIARKLGQPVIRELYGDRHYGADGTIVFTRDVGRLSPKDVAAKVLQACRQGTVTTVDGDEVPLEFDSICLHSDTPGALDLVTATRTALDDSGITVQSFTQKEIQL
ncbi:5-oxoprolinase subunit PxpA [Demetria terragena]|uniref:5-oxoprolinase subunit PxpA n=1 Tax=Demetria terragena TaxID=63959 RepID=UPI00037F8E4A|nr:5-oxoprolinase subunit PxpA [Demetria terragena]